MLKLLRLREKLIWKKHIFILWMRRICYEKISDYVLFKDLDGKYLTLKDCIEENRKEKEEPKQETAEEKAEQTEEKAEASDTDADAEKEPEKTTIYYVTDEIQQSQYINMFRAAGMDAVILKHNIDSPFITHLESRNEEVRFQRIDADVSDTMKGEASEEEVKSYTDGLTEVFRKALNNDKLEVKAEVLKDEKVASMMTLSEESRRMQEMMRMYGMNSMDPSMFGSDATLILNIRHPLVKYIFEHKDSDKVPMFCQQLYDLAMLAHKPLNPDEMTKFIARSNDIMMELAK